MGYHNMGRPNRSLRLAVIVAVLLLVLYSLTPYDSPIRSFFRFHSNVIEDYVQERHPNDAWLFKEQRYPVDPAKDIGIIVKTGYGTRERVPRALYALANETLFTDIIVTQDFPASSSPKHQHKMNGKPVPVVDIVGWNLERGALAGAEHMERISKYKHLASAVEAEEWQLADGLGKSMGWELDALKVSLLVFENIASGGNLRNRIYANDVASFYRAWNMFGSICPRRSGILCWMTIRTSSNTR